VASTTVTTLLPFEAKNGPDVAVEALTVVSKIGVMSK
jgi:hypothetical protein